LRPLDLVLDRGIRIAIELLADRKTRLNMRVCDVMRKPPVYCQPDTNLAAATALMWDKDCEALPVVDENARVCGVITDRDICIALGTRNVRGSEVTVCEVTSSSTPTCRVDDDIHIALNTMREARTRRLPVVNGMGGLEGMLSLDDAVMWAQHDDGARRPGVSYEDVVNTFRAICQHRSPPCRSTPIAA
jgi:CBS domain-containing protein